MMTDLTDIIDIQGEAADNMGCLTTMYGTCDSTYLEYQQHDVFGCKSRVKRPMFVAFDGTMISIGAG